MKEEKNNLEDYEVSLIKAMFASDKFSTKQEILAYFSRPTRSVNPARINEISDAVSKMPIPKASLKYLNHPQATKAQLEKFLKEWPNVSQELHKKERLIKAREAMITAVQMFNTPATCFKSELFIVIVCIAWTYLLHYYYSLKGVDIVYKDDQGNIQKTPEGANKYIDLSKCLSLSSCPLDAGTVANLKFLIGIRHEIEHRLTNRIDDQISAKLQACCLNFNHYIKTLFSDNFAIDKEFPIALQFSGIDFGQFMELKAQKDLPANILSFNTKFEEGIDPDTYNSPKYAYRVALVRKTTNNKNKADAIVEFVLADSEAAKTVNTLIVAEKEKTKFLFKHIKGKVHALGFTKFNAHHHAELWKAKKAKNPSKGFGVDVAGTWYWYETWLAEVIKHAKENAKKFKGQES